MWFALRLLGSIVVALILGFGSFYLSVYGMRGDAQVKNGAWGTNLLAGSSAADPYLRTYIALVGILALNKSETMYYEANTDSAGEPLDGACSYRIEGRDPAARWWSITVYAKDHYLIPNPGNRYSISKTTVVRAADGSFTGRMSTSPEAENWIATSADGFEVTLRLYNPDPSVVDHPDTATLPQIVKEACQ